jgi:hypothetical protein
MIPIPIISLAIAAAVAALAAWTVQGWRMDAALADLRNSHTQAQAELTARNAKHLARVWERGDELATTLASQQTRINQLHQEHTHAINRLTTGRACLSADLVRVLNTTDPAATDRPDALPPPTSSPAATDAPAFATDADVGTWAATARRDYAECAARLGALIEWHGPVK